MVTQETSGRVVSQIGQVALAVEDLEGAVAFYRDRLGLPFLFQFPGLAFFDCGGVRLMLSHPEPRATPFALYYRVPDIRGAYDALRARGVEFLDEPHIIFKAADHDLWMTFFRDPAGHTLALMSEVARS